MNELPKFTKEDRRRKINGAKFRGFERRNRKKIKEPWHIPDTILNAIVILSMIIFVLAVIYKMSEF
jgi:hypothetical protein